MSEECLFTDGIFYWWISFDSSDGNLIIDFCWVNFGVGMGGGSLEGEWQMDDIDVLIWWWILRVSRGREFNFCCFFWCTYTSCLENLSKLYRAQSNTLYPLQIVVQVEGEFGKNGLKPYFLGRMCFSSHTFPIRSVYSDRAASGCLTLISANSN